MVHVRELSTIEIAEALGISVAAREIQGVARAKGCTSDCLVTLHSF